MDIASLRRAYLGGSATPVQVIAAVLQTISEDRSGGIWIQVADAEAALAEARALERSFAADSRPPLYGVPFAVKDNIDVAGFLTTVACPDFAYVARESAPVVERLRAAGAVFVGKTNLDQLATGLVGARSPYGIPPNPFDGRYVTGGSSSGSAAAVARGQVTFALGTDTAGSGRVPAAFTHIVGLKPSRGLWSTRGVVPACRSLDCVSVLALTCDDARDVARVATFFDAGNPYSRAEADRVSWEAPVPGPVTVGVPRDEDRVFGDSLARGAFERALALLEAMGARLEAVDLSPFLEAGRLLYEGPWVAERLEGLQDFVRARPDSLLPVIRTILAPAARYSAMDAFRAQHRLEALRRIVAPTWSRISALVVPTAPELPTIEAVLADPVEVNARLGRYTTFVNLLDLAAVAVPSGLRPDGLPAGVTFIGPHGCDPSLLALASAFHARVGGTLGATGWPWPAREPMPAPEPAADWMPVVVVGAHLSGQPLNHQLTDRGGRFVRAARTAPGYLLYALPGTRPPKPGLVRAGGGSGPIPAARGIDVEVWALPLPEIGSFLADVKAPLGIGQIELDDGSRVHGFLCEAHAVEGARDISGFGGWRAYLSSTCVAERSTETVSPGADPPLGTAGGRG